MRRKSIICGLSIVLLAGCSSDESGGNTAPDASAGGGSNTGGGSTGGGSSTGGSSTGGSSTGGGSNGGSGGSANDAGDAGGGLVTYSGTVVAAVVGSLGNESPLAGVSVCVVDSKGAKVASIPCVTTDSKGAYSMPNLAPNQQIIVEYSKAGYTTQVAAVDVGSVDIKRIQFRLAKLVADGGADGGQPTNFGWDPSVVRDPKNGTVNVFAVQAAKADGGTNGLGVDYTTGVSFAITPKTGDGPFYLDAKEAWVSGATATSGGYGAWFLNLPPGTYTLSATSATLSCAPIPGNGYGWPQKDGTTKAPIIAGLNTQAVGFFCSPKVSDAGKD